MIKEFTQTQLEANKNRYLELIKSINVEGFEKEKFLEWLEKSDFFEAPASTHYHLNIKGGLCYHCLKVYDSLVKLTEMFAYHTEQREEEGPTDKEGNPTKVMLNIRVNEYTEDDIKIVALTHDLAKTNFYTSYFRNSKNETTNEWERIKEYKVRDEDDRFLFGSHEATSEYMASAFFPLTVEQSVAILHHMGGKGKDSAQDNITSLYNKYPLACLLHLADMVSTYIVEHREELIDEGNNTEATD